MSKPQPTHPESDILLTRKDVAQRHKVTVETVKRRERAGILPALKIGRTVRYRLSDIVKVESQAAVSD